MTMDDLAAEMERARLAVVTATSALILPLHQDVREHHAKLLADAHFARDVWWIARDHWVPAAMLFKLSAGAIDPRPRSI